jgi:hypothetical protein
MPGSAGSRWVGVGHSVEPDGRLAGKEAAAEALREDDAKLVLVFCSDRYDLAELLTGINETTGNVPLIGCSTAGEISTSGPGDSSLVVVAFGGTGMSASTRGARSVSTGLRKAGEEVAGCIQDVLDHEHQILMLLTDGLAGDQQEIVRGVYSVVGATVPLVGGCAGDDLKMKKTFQLLDGEVISDGVVAAALGSDAPFGIGVRHGWGTVGEPMVVTRSADNRVYELDNRPALDVYLQALEAPAEVANDPDAFTRFALTHPLGLSRRSEESQVRFIGEANFADRSLGCIAEVPQGAMVWLMEGDEDSVLHATDAACSQSLEPLGGQPPRGMIAFDCIARRGILGEQGIDREVERIARHADGSPVAGFYTYGEIARTKGISGFHNQTLVVLSIG